MQMKQKKIKWKTKMKKKNISEIKSEHSYMRTILQILNFPLALLYEQIYG